MFKHVYRIRTILSCLRSVLNIHIQEAPELYIWFQSQEKGYEKEHRGK